MPTLHVVITSTREGRAGLPIAEWFVERATQHGQFDVELVDLKAVNLPIVDEPHHPRLRKYRHAHTKAWSESVTRADAFVFVTPEYNYFGSPGLINAIDYVYWEWHYKPAGFVSYGGASGGMRSVQAVKPLLTTVKVMPLPEAVNIHSFAQHLDAGVFKSTEALDKAATVMLDELRRWTTALAPLRQPVAPPESGG